MRRKLITVAAAALIACFSAFILSSCGDSASSDPIVGEWHSTLLEDKSGGYVKVDDDLVTATAKSDGTLIIRLDATEHHGSWEYKETNDGISSYYTYDLGSLRSVALCEIDGRMMMSIVAEGQALFLEKQ